MGLTQIQSEGIGDGEVKSADLENSGVTAGTYGSSSAIPAITVDAKGRITSASTNNVNIPAGVGGANGVDFNDNVKARFGASNDLEIYHDGSNSYINEVGTGGLIAKSGDIYLRNPSDGDMVHAQSGGYVKLYHAGNEKLETRSNGVRVTGRVEFNGSNGRIEYNNTANTFEFFTSGNKVAEFLSSGHLVPGLNNTYNLGISSYKWKDGYFNGNVYASYYEADGSFRAKNLNGGIYLGDTAGGFGSACAIARAQQTSYHASGSQVGDLVIGAEYQKSILFGTTTSTSGGIHGRCRITDAGHFVPVNNNQFDLGTSSLRWRNLYTNDLNLSNEGSTNDVDGTWGSWTIQEGEDDLFLLNRRNGKKYKFNLTEVS
tara:strand:+ start:95 stop:1213 length:1119 start_codon:yes stop_codon:yes gene_type:complete